MDEYLKILGLTVADVVTGVTGIAESVCFDLYGCVQVIVRQRANDKGEVPDGRWYDFKRLQVVNATPVIVAAFNKPGREAGPADKPAPR